MTVFARELPSEMREPDLSRAQDSRNNADANLTP
jgi:hypothetical protein